MNISIDDLTNCRAYLELLKSVSVPLMIVTVATRVGKGYSQTTIVNKVRKFPW